MLARLGKAFYWVVLAAWMMSLVPGGILPTHADDKLPSTTGTGPTSNVHTYVVEGSDWDNTNGSNHITKQITEANRIWTNAGVNIKVHPPKKPIGGFPSPPGVKRTNILSKMWNLKADLKKVDEDAVERSEKFAKSLKPDQLNIAAIFTNQAKGNPAMVRGYTNPDLVNKNTPVILIGKKPASANIDEPGENRDLTHEIGHVVFRTGEEVSAASENLMNQDANISDYLTPEQKEKAQQYPAQPGVKTPPASSGATPIQTGKTQPAGSGATPIQTSNVGSGGTSGGIGGGATSPGTGVRSGGGGVVPGCPTTLKYAYAPNAVRVPKPADPNCGGPCPFVPGWHLPWNATCGGSGPPTQPAGVAAAGSQPSAPSASSGGGGSGCGPAPNCGGAPGCKPVGYKCLNNQWLGGHCECTKLP